MSDGWTDYPCGCASQGEHYRCCPAHYFSYNGPVEHLARAAHRRTHGIGTAWWDRDTEPEASAPNGR